MTRQEFRDWVSADIRAMIAKGREKAELVDALEDTKLGDRLNIKPREYTELDRACDADDAAYDLWKARNDASD